MKWYARFVLVEFWKGFTARRSGWRGWGVRLGNLQLRKTERVIESNASMMSCGTCSMGRIKASFLNHRNDNLRTADDKLIRVLCTVEPHMLCKTPATRKLGNYLFLIVFQNQGFYLHLSQIKRGSWRGGRRLAEVKRACATEKACKKEGGKNHMMN